MATVAVLWNVYPLDHWPTLGGGQAGAATSIHLASAPELDQVTGHFFANLKPTRSSRRSYDQATAAHLWQVSGDLVGSTRAR